MVFFEIADVLGERGEAHLLGFHEQHVEQGLADVGLPFALGLLLGLGAVVGKGGAVGVVQLPFIAGNGGFFGADGFGELELVVVVPDFDAD